MRPEDELQKAVVKEIRARKFPGVVFWHTPNGATLGGKNKFAQLNKLKAMGWRNGVSDLVFLHRREFFVLELKVKGTATEDQLEFMADAEREGAFCCVAVGLYQALAVLEAWNLIRRAA